MLETVFKKITAQQGPEGTSVWMVGEQLKDICRRESHSAELVNEDLDVIEMSLKHCEKKIKAYADAHRTGNFACVIPSVAEKIIRDFYGLAAPASEEPEDSETNGIISLWDLL